MIKMLFVGFWSGLVVIASGFAYDHAHDISGRARTPFSVFSHTIDHNGFKGGATFVLDKATLFSAVTDVILESGDTSKPYRYIPMFAPGTSPNPPTKAAQRSLTMSP